MFLGLGVNIRSIVIVTVLMILMMFAVHCTWVTSNAYSSPSIVLASYRPDGYVLHNNFSKAVTRIKISTTTSKLISASQIWA